MSATHALDQHNPKNFGENNSIQYGWSHDLDKKIVQFFFQLIRCENHVDLEMNLHDILSYIKGREVEYRQQLTMMYKLIGHTRDIVGGKGEQRLAFMQIWIWYQFYPNLAEQALMLFVESGHSSIHPYGSWKDIKYFCHYIYTKTCSQYHRLINFALHTALLKLENDWQLLQDSKNSSISLSLIGKWLPREKSKKFGWVHSHLARIAFPHFLQTAKTDRSRFKALLKCKIYLTKRLTTLNKYLDTVQIKQCGKEWAHINFNNITALTMRKQKLALLNKTSNNRRRSFEKDRIQCANIFKAHLVAAKIDPKNHQIRGRRCMTYELVKDALNAADKDIQEEKDIVNLQWQDNQRNNTGLQNIIACCDTSFSMESNNCIPLYNAIGLSIRCSELAEGVFKNRLLTFDAHPQWVNLEKCETFVDKVTMVRNMSFGLNTNFYKMLQIILDIYIQENIAPRAVENMILAIFSDMQIDPKWTGIENNSMNVMYDNVVKMYEKAGLQTKWKVPYKPPHFLFWNLRNTQGFPVCSSQKNVTMLSGYSSHLLNSFCNKGIKALKKITPYKMLTDLLDHKRYYIMELILDAKYVKKEHLKKST